MSSALASGCVLVHVDRTPSRSLGGSAGLRGCSPAARSTFPGGCPGSPVTALTGTQHAVELQGCSPDSLIRSLNTSSKISLLFIQKVASCERVQQEE